MNVDRARTIVKWTVAGGGIGLAGGAALGAIGSEVKDLMTLGLSGELMKSQAYEGATTLGLIGLAGAFVVSALLAT